MEKHTKGTTQEQRGVKDVSVSFQGDGWDTVLTGRIEMEYNT